MKRSDYDPGPLPSRPSPSPGETLRIRVDGYPPDKDVHFSIRNPRHPRHERFKHLRAAAIAVMAGRRWYDGPVRLDFTLYAPSLDRRLLDYADGIQDTLDGSHGCHFTYLPIVYEDDCQVCIAEDRFVASQETYYVVEVGFLSNQVAVSECTR